MCIRRQCSFSGLWVWNPFYSKMLWFGGDVPQALAKAIEEKSVVVVYIHGQDELSEQMNKVWEESSVAEAMTPPAKVVALKLPSPSQLCTQFAQIYPVVIIPSVFFLSHTGIPLEIVPGSVTSSTLIEKANTAFKLHVDKFVSVSASSQPSQGPSAGSARPSEAATGAPGTTTSESASTPGPSVSTYGAVGADTPGGSSTGDSAPGAATSGATGANALSAADRASAIQEARVDRRQREEADRAEADRLREIQRRRTGQEMAAVKEKQQLDEQKKIIAERQKEKADDAAARKKVQEAIARDKAEKAARFEAEKKSRQEQMAAERAEKDRVKAQEQQRINEDKSKNARIQFRFPDGSALNHMFEAGDSLLLAREFVASTPQNIHRDNFSLLMPYPKRTFTESDMPRTLKELGLSPSAVLVVIPGSSSAAGRPGQGRDTKVTHGGAGGGQGSPAGFLWTAFTSILAPLYYIWNALYGFIFATAPTRRPLPPDSRPPPRVDNASAPSAAEQRSSARLPRESVRQRRGNAGGMMDLRDDQDDNENNTWNGNSTQQM